MLFLYNFYLCKKQNDSTYICEKFDDFDQSLKHYRLSNNCYYSLKEFDTTIIPIFYFNPLKRHTLYYTLSKQFQDFHLKFENILIK